jgi:hypothetical protein
MWKFNDPLPVSIFRKLRSASDSPLLSRFLLWIPFSPRGVLSPKNKSECVSIHSDFEEINQVGKFSDGLSEISTLTPTSELLSSAPSQSSRSQSRSSHSSGRLHRASASEFSEPRLGGSSSHDTIDRLSGEGVGNRDSLSNQVKIQGPGLDGRVTAAFLANISSSNNTLLHQMIMEASRPNFQGSADDFSDFKRQ